jgi:hypothetical protein
VVDQEVRRSIVMTKTPTDPAEASSEHEFRAFRRRVLIGSLILGVSGVLAGLALRIPYVLVLAIPGIMVSSFKLATITEKAGA